MGKDSFEKKYKEKIENNQELPPDSAWEEIHNKLDVCDLWWRVDARLSSIEKETRRRRFQDVAAIIIALLLIGIIWFSDTKMKNEYNSLQISNLQLPFSDNTAKKREDVVANEDEKPLLAINMIKQDDIVPEPEIQNDQIVIRNFPDQKKDQYVPPSLDQEQKVRLNTNIKPAVLQAADNTKAPGKKTISFENLYVGATGHFINSWLMNEKTINGLKSDEMTNTNLGFGSNFGLLLGFSFRDKLSLETELNVYSQLEQSYNEYLHGEYVSNQIELNYIMLNVLLKYQFRGFNFVQGKNYLYLGPYFSYLNTAEQTIENATEDVKNYYSNYDYGIIAGYEHEWFLSGNIGIGTGLRVNYGLTNIFSGTEVIPAHFYETHNLSFSFTLAIKYQIN